MSVLAEPITIQILPSIDQFSEITDFNPSFLELVFLAENIPALGVKLYRISNDNQRGGSKPESVVNLFKIGDAVSSFNSSILNWKYDLIATTHPIW